MPIFPSNFVKYQKVCFGLAQDFPSFQCQVARPVIGSRAERYLLAPLWRIELGRPFGALLD